MRIGIITIQKSPASYGGNLQAFALWRFLSNLGHDVEIIDLYRPAQEGYINSTNSLKYHTFTYNPSYSLTSVKAWISSLNPRGWFAQIRKKRFLQKMREFAAQARYSRPYFSVDDLYNTPPAYDLLISGSDQIWNKDMKFEMAPYFLDFAKDCRKISYASSFGQSTFDESYKAQIKQWLSNYECVSVRENSGVELLDSLGIKSSLVLDPTFLLSSEEWLKQVEINKANKPFIMLFTLYNSERVLESVRIIAKEMNLEVYSNKPYKDFRCIADISVNKWLGYINSSSIVITDSFHATTFSIIFKKNIYSLVVDNADSSKRSTRLVNLLGLINLQDHLINENSIEMIPSISAVNYSMVDAILEPAITESQQFLHSVLAHE